MADQDARRNSEESAARENKRDRAPRERNPYTEWLREQMGESRRANRSGDGDELDPYGRSKR